MHQRILVPVDGGATSSQGLDEAIQLAKITRGSLRLIHAVDIMSFATGFEPYSVYAGELVPRMREVGEQILTEAKVRVAASSVEVEVDTLLFENLSMRVSELVIEQAKAWGADLIVIGTARHARWAGHEPLFSGQRCRADRADGACTGTAGEGLLGLTTRTLRP